jgi:hypothetical protein
MIEPLEEAKKEARRYRIKAFLWDQLIRPLYALASTSILKAVLLVFLIVSIIVELSPIIVYPVGVLLLVIYVYDIYKYWKSGEFMHNYRKYKFPDYKKATKAFKREEREKSQSLNTLNNLNNDDEKAEENSEG